MARLGAADSGGNPVPRLISRHRGHYVLGSIHGGRESGGGRDAACVGSANSQRQRGIGCALRLPSWSLCSQDYIWSCYSPVSLHLTIRLPRTVNCRMLRPRGCILRTVWV